MNPQNRLKFSLLGFLIRNAPKVQTLSSQGSKPPVDRRAQLANVKIVPPQRPLFPQRSKYLINSLSASDEIRMTLSIRALGAALRQMCALKSVAVLGCALTACLTSKPWLSLLKSTADTVLERDKFERRSSARHLLA